MKKAVLFCCGFAVASFADYPGAFSSSISDVQQFLGTSHAKLVYVDYTTTSDAVYQKSLKYIDFAENAGGNPTVHTISQAIKPTAPVISPDGKWVVYASAEKVSGENGAAVFSGKVAGYICRIAENATPVLIKADSCFEPRFLQNTRQLTVIYSTYQNGATTTKPQYAFSGTTDTVVIDTTGGTAKIGAKGTLTAAGPYNAGLSWDHRYLAASGGLGAILDLQSGGKTPAIIGKNQSGQVCNVSVSSSRIVPNSIMYIDFGSASKSYPEINNGNAWGKWQVIFIRDNSDLLRKQIPVPAAPKTEYKQGLVDPPYFFQNAQWHHCEWSNHPYFAVSALICVRSIQDASQNWKPREEQERIYLINLKEGSALELLYCNQIALRTGAQGFYWPWLWVEIPAGFQEESGWMNPGNAARNPVALPQVNHAIRCDGRSIISNTAIRRVLVYSAFGRCIQRAEATGSNQHRVALTPSLLSKAGAYLLCVESDNGERVTVSHIQTP